MFGEVVLGCDLVSKVVTAACWESSVVGVVRCGFRDGLWRLPVLSVCVFGVCGGFGCSYVFGISVGLAGGLIPMFCRASSCSLGVLKLQYSVPGKHVFWAGSARI